jgi:TP901 family phage tail tape measure protein
MAGSYQMLFELNAALGGGFTSAFTQGSQQIDNMKSKLEALNSMGSTGDLLVGISSALSAVGVYKGLEAVYETLQECAQASIEFESAMTGVSKTTDMSASELQTMSEAVMKLSTEIPVTTTELANVMEVAGQLGISKDNLLDFSTVMSQLATATTMTADEAATMLAQFANITQMDPSQYSNLASAVVDLGNNYATTEQKIVEMGQGIAAAGSLAGMSEADMMGLSAAVTSLGIETAAGSSSMSKLISQINKAVETGDGLDQFASVAGMSAQQFSQAWGDDAANALATFITGLNDVERNGASAGVILDDLGIKEVRMQRMILSLAGSGDLMSNAIRDANDAFRENTALTAEAEKRYATTESRLTMMQNAANNVKIAIGDALTPVVASVASGLTQILEPMAEFIEQNPAVVQGLTAFVAVLGVAAGVIAAYTAITKLAAAANLLFAGSIPGIGIILAVAAGVGALVAGIGLLAGAISDANPSFEELDAQFDNLNEQAKEQQAIIDLAEEYKQLSDEIAATEAAIKFKAELDIGDVSEENLKLIDDLKSKMVNKEAELKQTLELAGADKITDEDMARLIELASNAQTSDDTIRQTLELMGVDEVTPEMIQQVRDFAGAITTDSGTLEQQLRLIGFDDATVTSMGYANYKDFVDDVAAGNVVVNADGTITQKLDLGKVAPTDLELIKEIAENNGYAVTADGKVTQTLDIGGFKEKDLQQLERLRAAVTNEEAKLTQKLELLGVENITPEKLDTFLQIKTNTADGNHQLKQLLELEGAENATPAQINQIKQFIKNVQTKEGKVTQKLEAMVSTEQLAALGYASMADFVAAVNAGEVVVNADGTVTQTVNVEGDVAALKQAWEDENALAEAEAASAAAADELAAKRARLKEVTDSLRDSSGGMISATEEETEALRNQIEAYEAVAQARKDAITAQALDTVQKQSKQYVQSLQDEAAAMRNLESAQGRAKIAQELTAGGNAAEYLRTEFESLVADAQAYEGFNWLAGDDEAAKSLQERFYGLQETINAITGQKYDFFGSGLAGMGATIEGMKTDTLSVADGWKTAIEEAGKYADQVEAADKIQQEYLQNLINGVADGTMTYDQLRDALTAAYADYENGGEIVAETMKQVEAGVNAAKAAAEGSGTAAQTEAETTVAAVGSIITQMENLKKAYDEAKESAKQALGSRFGLFDDVGEGAESKTTSEMQSSMDAQTKYWDQYNANLQAALDKGLAPEIAKQMADGSAESAASLATLAEASEEEIQKINDKFAEVEASKDALASTIADMQTNFTEGMEALKTELENTVKELDKGSDAAKAAAATMEAYVAGLEAAEGDASSEASAIADAVNAALSTIADVDVDITYHYKTDGSPPEDAGGGTVGEHAIGTDYAAAGLTLVGEEGPELVMMSGGEKVLTANETVNALSGASGEGGKVIEVSFSPVYNVSGGGNAGEIRSMLEAQAQSLRDQVENIMDEVLSDRKRTAYA